MANPWFRLYSEFAFDQKVQMLSEVDQRRLIMLFCFRCSGNVTLQDEEVTFQLRCSNDEWLKTKATFIAKGFINEHNEVLNWDKRQYISDSSAERVARHRDKKKGDVTLCNVTVTPPEQNRTEQKQNKVLLPKDFAISERVITWANKEGYINLQKHFDNFVLSAQAKGYAYVNWDSAFMSAIRANWANVSPLKKGQLVY
jgi:hypothetical protein